MRSSGAGSSSRPQRAGERQRQLERQAGRGQVAERIGAAGLPRIDVQRARRQLAAGQVMIGDHHVDAGGAARSATASAAELPQSAVTISRQPSSRAPARTWTGWKPYPSRSRCGRMASASRPQAREHGEEERGGGDAVDVVVADDRDLLAARRGPRSRRSTAALHAGEQERVVELVERRVQEALGVRRRRVTPRRASSGASQRGKPGRARGRRRRRAPAPRTHSAAGTVSVSPRRRPRGRGTAGSGGRRARCGLRR